MYVKVKLVNKFRILSSVSSPGKRQELDMHWFHSAHSSLSLHLQLDNWHFFGFILYCEPAVLSATQSAAVADAPLP